MLGLRERAAQLKRQIDDAEVQAVSAEMMSRRRGPAPSVYFEVDRTPYAAGPSSFIGELLDAARRAQHRDRRSWRLSRASIPSTSCAMIPT